MVGIARGSLTNARGEFLIANVPAGSHQVRAQLLGYGAQVLAAEVAPGGSVRLDFELQTRAIDLDEVVVVGYGTQSRREVSAAVSSVASEEIQRTPLAGVDAALQGRAAGVQVVQNAGNPGNAVTVRVRGSSSISAGNQPLWVIDGVPMYSEDFSQLGMGGQNISAVTSISPEEIETIDILKDAAATAIYGSRGSNGVVVVTTKRGRAAAPSVTFSAYTGTQQASRRLALLDAREYLEYFNESAANDGRNPQLYGVPGVDDRIHTDWQDAVLRTAPVSSFELGLVGGDERIRYRVSGALFSQEGIVIGSAYQRASGRANLDFNTTDRLSFSASLAFSREDNDRIENDGSTSGIITNVVGNPPLVPLRRDDGTYSGIDEGLVYPNSVALASLNTAEALTQRTLGTLEGRLILAEVPDLPGMNEVERNQILGEALALRALHHHNLTRLWGDVPLVTRMPASVEEASQVTRSPRAEVYAAIVKDLGDAERLVTNTSQTRQISLGAVEALLARVHLYRGDWPAAEAKADEVLARGYTLASNFPALFAANGGSTSEDIFRVIFTASDYNNIGYYYNSRADGGRGEVGTDQRLIQAFEPGDARRTWSIKGTDHRSPATKFPTTAGTEHVHVIRLAEVILIRAEALARQGRLPDAVSAYNRIRERAGLSPHVLGMDVVDADDVLQAIHRERRLELAFEGDRWSDLVRLGTAGEVMGIPSTQTLYPVPQTELDVAPNLTQNPGY